MKNNRLFINYHTCSQMDASVDEDGKFVSDDEMKRDGYVKVTDEEFDRYFIDYIKMIDKE